MSDSCSKDSALASILRNTDHGFFWRLFTSALMPCFSNRPDSAFSISPTHALVALEDLGEPLGDGAVGFRIDVAEGELLQLLAHALHAHAAGQRRIDVHRLLGDAQALVFRHMVERAHVVQAVGELDQQHAHVFGDRQQQLAQVLRLLGLLGDEVELLELGQALDQLADFRAEQLVDLGAGRGGVLDRVVQQRDRDGRLVEMHVGEDRGDFERMREIGIAGGALLMAMLLHGVDIGLVEQRLVDVRLVALDALDKLILTHHGRDLRGAEMNHAPQYASGACHR